MKTPQLWNRLRGFAFGVGQEQQVVFAHPGPELGQHNNEIYRNVLNFDDDRLAALAAAGAYPRRTNR